MEPKRKRSRFSAYEVAVLRQNPYTHEVRQTQISFTSEFKKIFWARYQAGEYIPEIFNSLGYDPNILGIGRMYSLATNLRKCVAAGREFTSGYTRHISKEANCCTSSNLNRWNTLSRNCWTIWTTTTTAASRQS